MWNVRYIYIFVVVIVVVVVYIEILFLVVEDKPEILGLRIWDSVDVFLKEHNTLETSATIRQGEHIFSVYGIRFVFICIFAYLCLYLYICICICIFVFVFAD